MKIINPPIYTEYACAEEDIPVVFVQLWGLVVTDIINAGYDPETVHQAWCTALAEEIEQAPHPARRLDDNAPAGSHPLAD